MTGPAGTPLAVVIPLRNEAAGIPALAARLADWIVAEGVVRAIEVVAVDDASTDATRALLAEHLAPLGASILRLPEHAGLTAALRAGSEAARSELVGWLDSDLTYDPAVLGQLAAAVDAGADLALASCYHPAGGVEGVAGWRRALSAVASAAYRGSTRAPVHTFTCMVRVHRRELLERCWPRRGGFLGITEMLLRAIDAGARVAEVPAVLRRRRLGQSKMRVLRVGLGHLGMMARWWARRGPGGTWKG